MKLKKYLWLIGVILGAWLIKASWYDVREGPVTQWFGFLVILFSLTILAEAYRKEIISDVKMLLNNAEKKPKN